MFPSNVIQATMQQVQTNYVLNETNREIVKYELIYKDGVNILGRFSII